MLSIPSLQKLPPQWQAVREWLETEKQPDFGQSVYQALSEHECHALEQDFLENIGISLIEFIRIKCTAVLLQQTYPNSPNLLTTTIINTPLGDMLAVFGDKGLSLLEFIGQKGVEKELNAVQKALCGQFVFQENEQTRHLKNELDLYFQCRLKQFNTPIQMVGTAFQQQVWHALLAIPHGETRSYKEQAEWLNNPKAIRAVAAANGQNKISIIIPCHRVIGSNGTLVGYAGGVNRKQALLALERGETVQNDLFE